MLHDGRWSYTNVILVVIGQRSVTVSLHVGFNLHLLVQLDSARLINQDRAIYPVHLHDV